MKNITAQFQEVYLPIKALVVYKSMLPIDNEMYVEAYDMDEKGRPINGRPLNIEESEELSKSLKTTRKSHDHFLKSNGLLPQNLLYLDQDQSGCAVWYTKPRQVQLFFKESLPIPCGKAWVPALLWNATKTDLYVYALRSPDKPTIKTALYHAPFFNLYSDGKVCMGTVDTDMQDVLSLQDFIRTWEQYFFNSYFSHLLEGYSPVEGNIVQLWQNQIATHKRFPTNTLKKHSLTLKQLLP
jgi:PRTRC genetic system protein B